MKTITLTEFVDWKDTEGIIQSIKDSLKEMGINMINNPFDDGQDGYSFIIADEEYYEEHLREIVSDEIIYLYDGDELSEEEGKVKINEGVEQVKKLLSGGEQSIPDGTTCIFSTQDIGYEEFFDTIDTEIDEDKWNSLEGAECDIISLETFSELGEKDYEYYNIRFGDGTEISGISGYHLEVFYPKY